MGLLPWAHSRIFFRLSKTSSPKTSLWNSSRPEVWFRKSFGFREFTGCRTCKNTGRQECYSETIERTQVIRPPSDKYGENSGDPVHFSSTQSSEMQIGDHALGRVGASQRLSICLLNCPVLNRTTDVFIRKRQRRMLRHGFG